jgi:hypothetical protein
MNNTSKINIHKRIPLAKPLALLALAMTLSACHVTMGTPSAIREYHRGLNGMISEGKASPDKEGAYWQTQKQFDGLRLGGGQ